MRPISLKALTGSLFMTLCAAATALSATAEADSLSAALSRARTPAEREQTYVRLADLCADSTALAALYWEAALTEAAGAGDDYGCREALDRLVQGFSAKQPERALEYVRLADSLLPDRRFALFRASLNAFWLWKQMSVANSFEAIDRALAEFRERQPGSLTPEEEIEWEFLTGLSIDYSSIATEAYGNILQAIPYVEQALAKLEKYPLEERVHFEKLCREELADIYLYADDPRAAGQIGRCIDLHRAWMAADTRFERPRRDSSEYLMRSYGKMVFLGDLLAREEVDDYYNKCMELARGRDDREEIYNTSARYYQHAGDYERTAAYMDSLLTHYAQTGKKADLGSIYIAQSHMYEKAGDYEKALKAVREGNDFRYYSRMDQAQSKLAEMQALYDVNRLELEKVRLADRSKFFLLMAGGIVLLLLAGWAVYQQTMVRRLKLARTQFMAASEEAQRQSRRAQESERMKTAFINSMCHEIRTPLNAINGFSELLLTEQDPAARQAFQTEIGKSTKALTVLLENMLELSQLISTEDPLPVAQTDICLLCAERLELQRQLGDNPAVGYAYEAVEEGIEIPTNAFYLTRVLDNLLHNAAKFTAAGRITLRCRNDESRRTLQISVSDTGIGIPPEKQEWVFERFTKVDPFKPGSGIGLYLCRLIVTRLGGDIRVCPEYSGGCCIRIELPY